MTYLTSDLHGYSLRGLLEFLYEKLLYDSEEDSLYVLGDVIDRGVHGIELLRWMMKEPSVELLMGNHEAMMLSSMELLLGDVKKEKSPEEREEELSILDAWFDNGGVPTFKAFRKLSGPKQRDLLDYLRDCPLYRVLETDAGTYILVHGGFKNFSPERKLSSYKPEELLWTRPDFERERYFNRDDITVIVGHTPTMLIGNGEYARRFYLGRDLICLDTGSGYGARPGFLCLETMEALYL